MKALYDWWQSVTKPRYTDRFNRTWQYDPYIEQGWFIDE